MIYPYLALVIGLCIFDVIGLKKQGQKKEIFVFLCSMLVAAVYGVLCFSTYPLPSVGGMFLDILHASR